MRESCDNQHWRTIWTKMFSKITVDLNNISFYYFFPRNTINLRFEKWQINTNQHHKMQRTCSNSFESKKRNATLCQARIGKHECRSILLLLCCIRVYPFSPDEVVTFVLRLFDRNNCCQFFPIMILICEVFIVYYFVISKSVPNDAKHIRTADF